MNLIEKTIEREGNDAWLVDHLQLRYSDYSKAFVLTHQKRWKSGYWNNLNEDFTLELPIDNLEQSQIDLDNHLYNKSLENYISIQLQELLNDINELA